MERRTYKTPLIGFAESVRMHGDNWKYGGMRLADRMDDEGRKIAFSFSDGDNSPDWKDGWRMLYIAKYNGPKV